MITDSLRNMIERSSLLWKSVMVKIGIKPEIIKDALLTYEKTILYARDNNYEIDSKIIAGILKRLLEIKKQYKNDKIIDAFGISKTDLNKYYKNYISIYEKSVPKLELKIKEPEMKIGTDILRLIVDSIKFNRNAKNYGLESGFPTINIKIPKELKLPPNFLKNMKSDIKKMLNKKIPEQVIYPWAKKDYDNNTLKEVVTYIEKSKVVLVRNTKE